MTEGPRPHRIRAVSVVLPGARLGHRRAERARGGGGGAGQPPAGADGGGGGVEGGGAGEGEVKPGQGLFYEGALSFGTTI